MPLQDPFISSPAQPNAPTDPVPAEILTQIKHAWVAGLFSAAVTLIVTLVAMSGTPILGFSAWELIDVALVLGLTFGIYRKSRTCAVVMLVYFLISKIMIVAETGKPTGLVMGFIFLYFYWHGVTGTFAYHRLKTGIGEIAA